MTWERNTRVFLRGEVSSKLSAMLLLLTELRACRRQGSLAIVHAVREVSQLAVQSLECWALWWQVPETGTPQ